MKMNRIVMSVFAVSVLGLPAMAQEKEKKITAKEVPAVEIENFKGAYPKTIIRGYPREMGNGQQYYGIGSQERTTIRHTLFNLHCPLAAGLTSLDPKSMP